MMALHDNCLINLPCGVGKTLIAIEAGRALMKHSQAHRNLVIVWPKVTTEQWRRAIRRQDPDAQIEVWSNKTRYTDLDLDNPIWVIINCDYLAKVESVLSNYKWATIICDEVHKFKNKDTQRTLALKKIEAYRKIGMSATLIEKSAADLWAPLNWIRPKQYTSYWRFFNKYVLVEEGYLGYQNVVGTKPEMIQDLADELRNVVYRRSRLQVAPDMPPMNLNRVPIELLPAQRKMYDKIRKAKDVEVDIGRDEAEIIMPGMGKFTWLHRLASDPMSLGVDLPSAKVDWLQGYVDNNPEEQMVIFSRYRKVAERMAKLLDGALVLGGQPPQGLDEFLDGKKQIMCGTIGAMGTGLDLPDVQTCVFMDSDWSTTNMDQAMRRIDRISNLSIKNAVFLEATKTVDQRVRKVLDGKINDQAMLNGFLEEDDDDDAESD